MSGIPNTTSFLVSGQKPSAFGGSIQQGGMMMQGDFGGGAGNPNGMMPLAFGNVRPNKNGKEPKDVFPIIKKWLDGADYIVGHNIIGFDIYLIKEMYKMFGEDYKHLVPKLIDTNCIARGVKMEIPYKPEEDFTEYQYRIVNTRRKGVRSSLTALGKEFNIDHDYDKLHNAIVDLELNLKVWNKLKYALEL